MEIKKDKDPLGTRIKDQYENRTRYYLPRRTYTIIRLDGKTFRNYTKGLNKPFDKELIEDIDSAIIDTLPEIQGAVFAYTQSDEISILLTDFATPQTSAWYDGNIQKICSVSASIITAQFNKYRLQRFVERHSLNLLRADAPIAYFDSRTFTIPDRIEVMNYFIWRNQDCARNSVSMVAQQYFSHKELHGKSTPEMHEMLHKKGANWATDYTTGEKNGRLIVKQTYCTGGEISPTGKQDDTIIRTRWVSKGAWKFTEDKEKLLTMIPKYE